MRFITQQIFLLLVAMASLSQAAEVDYLRQIKPLLKTKCYSCHGVLKQEAGLRVDTRSLMLAGGDSGAILHLQQPSQSLLLERVTEEESLRMPPAEEGSELTSAEIDLLRNWIRQGAPAPDEKAQQSPLEHWAFQPVPVSNGTEQSIDKLLRELRDAKGLIAQPQADRSILIRRLYIDLVGLPPTREQQMDERPWEQIVDELLASPHYGERWGRHWMDIWRYSDWYGLNQQLRNSQKHLWHWRDWIVNSLNEDKGYDRMIQEMIAGDELAPADDKVVAGTGFLARNYYLFNRTTWLDSTIEHTGKAFLGMTFNCAKCHDHKYDPISQVDYYSLRAIFEPHQVRLDPVPGTINLEDDGLPRVFDDHLDVKTYLHRKGNPKDPDMEQVINPRVPEIFADSQPDIQAVELPPESYVPALRDYVQKNQIQNSEQKIKRAKEKLQTAKANYEEWLQKESTSTPEKTVPEFVFQDDFSEPNPDAWI